MKIQRLYFNQLTSTFFQTSVLLLLAYLTLFIDIANFSDRFMGSITALLVIAALLASFKEDLPKTSYFKYIDLWFMWNIINIFIITVYHIALDQIMKRGFSNGTKINGLVKYGIFPIVTIFFCTFFFSLLYYSTKKN